MLNNLLQDFFLNNFDRSVAVLLLAESNSFAEKVFSLITFLGDWKILLPLALVAAVILYFKNKKRSALFLAITVIGVEGAVFLGKMLFNRPRPETAALLETGSSFPSNHAAIALVFYSCLAYILIKEIKGRYLRLVVPLIAFIIIFLIGFSRLFLGVHYLSDVLAGYLIGAVALVIGNSLAKYLSPKFFKR